MERMDRTRMESFQPTMGSLGAEPVEDWQVVDEMPNDAGFEPEELAWFTLPEAGLMALQYEAPSGSDGLCGRIFTFVRSLVSMQVEPA